MENRQNIFVRVLITLQHQCNVEQDIIEFRNKEFGILVSGLL